MEFMRIFKHKAFTRWALDEGLPDKTLIEAVLEIEKGFYEANLGSGLYKKRIAMIGKGKNGGYRTLVACKIHDRAFFLYGFAKNERANITDSEEKIYRKLSKDLMGMDLNSIENLLKDGKFIEVR
jgi:hypothetical protein